MPGSDALYEDSDDLSPQTPEDHADLLGWCNREFIEAEIDRKPFDSKWLRYYKMYRSHVPARKSGEWRSRVFVPICFWVIETIAPRLVAQLPRPIVNPVGPEDVPVAKVMEKLLERAAKQFPLHEQMVDAVKSALIYGTGIVKTFYDEKRGFISEPQPVTEVVPVQEPVLDPMGMPALDLDGNPMVNTTEVEQPVLDEMGQPVMEMVKVPAIVKEGPAAEAVDLAHFYIAPGSTDIDSARYVIHRTYRPVKYIKQKIKEGKYKLPEGLTEADVDIWARDDDPAAERRSDIDMGGGDAPKQDVELLEYHLDDGRIITMMNRKAILRVTQYAYDHNEKPFIRIVDHRVPHEFWGIGEIEQLEGLQDFQNALVNQRIDNVRLTMERMFAVNIDNLEDPRDLQTRPGGVIRTKGDMRPDEVLMPIDLGDVTSNAYVEAEYNERVIEKVSGVSGLQMGVETTSMTDTATGMAMLNELGASRFGLKTRLFELMGWNRLFRHFGSNIQQFTDKPLVIRMLDAQGAYFFPTIDPMGLQAQLDYDIESGSSTQTETIRREQAMSLLQLVGQYWPQAIPGLLDDLFEAFNKPDKMKYMAGQPTMQPTGQPGQVDPYAAQYTPPEQVAGQNMANNAVNEAAQNFEAASQV